MNSEDTKKGMYERHYRAIYQICWKVLNSRYSVDIDDLLQEAYLIIKLKFEPSFDAERGCSEVGFLFKYLPYHLRRYQKQFKICDSLNKPLPDYEDVELMDVLQDESVNIEGMVTNKVFDSQLQKTVHKEISTLPEVEQEILKQRYFHKNTLKETAAEIGINLSERVRCIQARAERRLRSRASLIKLKNEILENRAYRHVTLKEFKYTRTSAVEKALHL